MDRVPYGGYAEAITGGLDLIPEALHPRVAVDFLCGVDPVFAGLHRFPVTDDGRSYADTAHCAYPHHMLHLPADRRRTTVVLPDVDACYPWVVVHELGHALHATIDWRWVAEPVTDYAEVNEHEAFAEAFAAWLVPEYEARPDDETLAFFETLALGL